MVFNCRCCYWNHHHCQKKTLIILKCGKSILYFTDPSQYGWPLLTMICLTLTQLGQLSQCKLVTESEDLWTKQKFIFTLYCRIDLAYRNLTLFLVYIGEYFNHTWRYFTLGFLFLSIHSEWNWSSWSKRHWGSTARRNFLIGRFSGFFLWKNKMSSYTCHQSILTLKYSEFLLEMKYSMTPESQYFPERWALC